MSWAASGAPAEIVSARARARTRTGPGRERERSEIDSRRPLQMRRHAAARTSSATLIYGLYPFARCIGRAHQSVPIGNNPFRGLFAARAPELMHQLAAPSVFRGGRDVLLSYGCRAPARRARVEQPCYDGRGACIGLWGRAGRWVDGINTRRKIGCAVWRGGLRES